MKDKKDKKRMNNKGFSFVELIIAIAILAIMAGVLAPQLIKYIDSSRKSTDVQNAQAIATAVNIALANEDAYNAAKTKAGETSNYYKVNELSSIASTDPNYPFAKEVVDILGKDLPTPKYSSGTYKDFVIIFKTSGSSGSSLSFYIYPCSESESGIVVPNPETATDNKLQLYPNVGDNYTK